MALPSFPDFAEIDLSFRKEVNDFLMRYPLEASEYTFTNMFAFMPTYNFKLALLHNNMILLKDDEAPSFFCPIGNSNIPDVLKELFDWLNGHSEKSHMERVPESFLDLYIKSSGDFDAEEKREHFDYVYGVNELIELKGRQFHDKKNKVNKFRSLYSYEYLSLTPDLIDECLEFEDYWCEIKECEKFHGLYRERCAILRMLYNLGPLNITGGAIRIDGRIAALSLGEKFLEDTMVIHVEKANPDIPGLYQLINQEFLMHESGSCRFVNREQDLGVEGLRRAKMSYNPVRFVRKYTVKKRAS